MELLQQVKRVWLKGYYWEWRCSNNHNARFHYTKHLPAKYSIEAFDPVKKSWVKACSFDWWRLVWNVREFFGIQLAAPYFDGFRESEIEHFLKVARRSGMKQLRVRDNLRKTYIKFSIPTDKIRPQELPPN